MTRARPNLAIPALLIANVVLAAGVWFVRLARDDGGVGPNAAGFWRLTLVLPVLIALARFVERPKLERKPVILIALGGLAFGADLSMWHFGILHTRLANATLIGNLAALAFPLYGFWMARSWPQARQWIALALATVGGMLLLGRSYSLSATNLIGDIACIGAGLSYLLYLILADRSLGRVPPITALVFCCLTGAPLMLAAALVAGEPIWPRDWTALIALSVGSQLIGQGLMLYGVAKVQPLIVGLMMLLQAVVAAGIGWVLYGERLSLLDFIGAIAIGIAVLLVRDAKKPESLPPTEGSLSSAT